MSSVIKNTFCDKISFIDETEKFCVFVVDLMVKFLLTKQTFSSQSLPLFGKKQNIETLSVFLRTLNFSIFLKQKQFLKSV